MMNRTIRIEVSILELDAVIQRLDFSEITSSQHRSQPLKVKRCSSLSRICLLQSYILVGLSRKKKTRISDVPPIQEQVEKIFCNDIRSRQEP